MARIFTTGFESGSLVREFVSYIGTPTVQTSTVRSGSYAFQMSGGAGAEARLEIPQCSEFYLRFGLYMVNFPNWGHEHVQFQDENGVVQFRLTWADGQVIKGLVGSTSLLGPTVLSRNQWYVVEVHYKVADAGGVFEVRVDGTLQFSWIGDTKIAGDTVRFLRFSLTYGIANGYNVFDDMAVNDVSGLEHNSWCGDGRVIALKPNGNGVTSQWNGSDGDSIDNYLLVDDVPPVDTDYVHISTAGQTDLYQVENLPVLPPNSVIRMVWTEAQAREATADADNFQLGIRNGATELWSASQVLTLNWKRYVGPFHPKNPDTSNNWAESEVNTLQVGVKSV